MNGGGADVNDGLAACAGLAFGAPAGGPPSTRILAKRAPGL
jgi:hypothetical protein